MAASVQFRPQSRDLGVMMREVDENLAIYLGIQNKINNEHLLLNEVEDRSDEFDYSKETKPDNYLLSEMSQLEIVEMAADDNLLINLETDKGDNDWLNAEPDLSVLPSVETKEQDLVITEAERGEGIVSPKSEKANASEESASPSKPKRSSAAASSNKRPSSLSGTRKPNSRPSTPSVKSILPSNSKASRPSTPTSRVTLPSSKAKPEQTTVSRPSVSKSSSRSSTPTRKISTPSSSDRSSTGQKLVSTASKNPASSRVGSSSQTVKPKPSKSPDILSMSHDAAQNAKIIMRKRPVSASRGRPISTNSSSSSSSSNGKLRQKSLSPAKTRVPIVPTGTIKTGSVMLSRSRGYGVNSGDDVNPVIIGTKMVERVINMRKLAPPKQDEYTSLDNKPKKSSKDNSGFGRSLSNKSLDMAIRHMDIRRSIPENLRPVATSSVKSRTVKSDLTPDVTESPLTSSSGSESSKYSVQSCESSIVSHFNNGNDMDD